MVEVDYREIGRTGLKQNFGIIDEEFERDLRGALWDKAVLAMQNDPVVAAMLFAAEMLARQVTWRVDAFSEETESEQLAEFVDGALFHDMSLSWPDTLAEILSFLPWGWNAPEIVWKQRLGETPGTYRTPDGEIAALPKSRFDDGLIGVRKLAPRAQETRDRWLFDNGGGVRGWWQVPAPDYIPRFLPIEKLLLFRTTSRKGNPEGRSILRGAYRPWYYKHHMEKLEAIGVERELAGLPVMRVPGELLATDATADQKAALKEYERIVSEIKRDEREGILLPSDRDDRGEYQYTLELLASGGGRQIDPDKPIQRYDVRIAGSVLADFVLLGHEKVGSYALADSKASIFCVALGAWLDEIVEVINRHLIPRWLALNGMDLKRAPRVAHGKIEQVNLQELGDYIAKLAGAGIQGVFNPAVERYLLEVADLPYSEDDEADGDRVRRQPRERQDDDTGDDEPEEEEA